VKRCINQNKLPVLGFLLFVDLPFTFSVFNKETPLLKDFERNPIIETKTHPLEAPAYGQFLVKPSGGHLIAPKTTSANAASASP